MTTPSARLKWAAEGLALMLATAGAAVVAYLDLPEPERVAPPEPSRAPMRLLEVELVELPRAQDALCHRGYSSAASASRIDQAMVEEFTGFMCAQRPDCSPISPETAICIAEERFFGEGRARSITYIANPFAWVVSGEHQRVFVDAQSGDAVAINFADEHISVSMSEDELVREVPRATGR